GELQSRCAQRRMIRCAAPGATNQRNAMEDDPMNKRIPFPALRPLLAAGVFVAAVGAGPAWAAPRTFTIDPGQFAIAIPIDRLGYADVIGMFLKGSGSFVYDEVTRTLTSGRVVVAADSVFSNHKARDRHVRDSDFLDADSHPEIVFE